MSGRTKSVNFSPQCRGLKVVTKNKVDDAASSVKDDPLEETKRLMDLYVNEQIKNREVSYKYFFILHVS